MLAVRMIFIRRKAMLPVALALAFASCGTVDPGPDTMPPPPCNAPTPFFVSDVWPKYFDFYSCGKGGCHDASTGHGYFRLQSLSGVTAPQPTDSFAIWPTPWQQNLLAVQHVISCGNPTQSMAITEPAQENKQHGGGQVVMQPDLANVNALFSMWLP
jgi:hypothetical protein